MHSLRVEAIGYLVLEASVFNRRVSNTNVLWGIKGSGMCWNIGSRSIDTAVKSPANNTRTQNSRTNIVTQPDVSNTEQSESLLAQANLNTGCDCRAAWGSLVLDSCSMIVHVKELTQVRRRMQVRNVDTYMMIIAFRESSDSEVGDEGAWFPRPGLGRITCRFAIGLETFQLFGDVRKRAEH